MMWYYEYVSFCNSENMDLKLACGNLGWSNFGAYNHFEHSQIVSRLGNIIYNIYLHME